MIRLNLKHIIACIFYVNLMNFCMNPKRCIKYHTDLKIGRNGRNISMQVCVLNLKVISSNLSKFLKIQDINIMKLIVFLC